MANTLELLNYAQGSFLAAPPMVITSPNTSAQGVPNLFTGLALSLNTPTFDPYGLWSGGTPTRITPKTAGWYYLTGSCNFSTNTTGNRVIQFQKNGLGPVTYSISTTQPALNSSSYTTNLNCSGLLQFNGTTDYVELWAYQDSGGTLNTTSVWVSALFVHN